MTDKETLFFPEDYRPLATEQPMAIKTTVIDGNSD